MATSNKSLADMSSSDTLPWIEKYRPKSLSDVVSQENIVATLRNFIKTKTLPHMLFHGQPGTGKTSVITACAKELYGDKYDMMVIEINASEERGIEVVRNRITNFATKKSLTFDEESDKIFKLVILDESDAMTPDAQASLRRVIEKYTFNVRFCLICNNIKKINLAVQSRCICFRFSPLKEVYIREKIMNVIEKEKVNINKDGVDTIIKRSKGDMRRVLNTLQSVDMAYGKNDVIDDIAVDSCLGYPSSIEINKLINVMIKGTFKEAFDLLSSYKNVEGYSLGDIITEIHGVLVNIVMGGGRVKLILSIEQTRKIIELLRELEHNMTNSTSETIHIGGLVGSFKHNI